MASARHDTIGATRRTALSRRITRDSCCPILDELREAQRKGTMLGTAWFPRPMAGPPEEVRSRRSLDARRSFVASSNRRQQMLSRLYGYGCHPNRDSRSSPGRDSPTRTADTIPVRSSTLRRAILVQQPRQCSLVPLRRPFDRPVSFSRIRLRPLSSAISRKIAHRSSVSLTTRE